MRIKLLKSAYSVLITLGAPLLLLHLWFRGRKNNAYRQRWGERFGFCLPPSLPEGALWVHAVSVGETMAILPWIKQFQAHWPEIPILVTTTTPTGSALVQSRLVRQGDNVAPLVHVYLPYDIPWALQRWFRRVRPKVCVLMETELWPNLLFQCKKCDVPVVIANARLSPKSMRGYRWISLLVRSLLSCVTFVAAQSEADGNRFLSLGLRPEQLHVLGNLKYDSRMPLGTCLAGEALRKEWGENRPVLIAASTHEGEEALLLNIFQEIRKKYPELLLILVPRHPERFPSTAQLIRERGFKMVRRSERGDIPSNLEVYLGDTMGELGLLYAASDMAFVGGSFVKTGGHNVLESALAGIPVLVGPHTFNFEESVGFLEEARALVSVSEPDALAAAVAHWLEYPEERKAAGKRASGVVLAHQGATEKLLALVHGLFS